MARAASTCVVKIFNVNREDEILHSIHLHREFPTVSIGVPSAGDELPYFVNVPQLWSGSFTFELNLVHGLLIYSSDVANAITVHPDSPARHVIRVRYDGVPVFAQISVGEWPRVILTDAAGAEVECSFVNPVDGCESGLETDTDGEDDVFEESITRREHFDRVLNGRERQAELLHESLYASRLEEIGRFHAARAKAIAREMAQEISSDSEYEDRVDAPYVYDDDEVW